MNKEYSELKVLFLLILFAIGLQSVNAQVTVGSASKPLKAAILDLKTQEPNNPIQITDDANITSTKGGLALSRVKLVNRKTLEPFLSVTETTPDDKIEHTGLTVYNIHVSPSTETENNKIFKIGMYTWNGEEWVIIDTRQDFFYMPSFNLPLPTVSINQTFNLYNVYKKQFSDATNTSFVSSSNAIRKVPGKYACSELDFVVTYYDDSVIKINSISPDGVMDYDILKTNPGKDSFINIILIVK